MTADEDAPDIPDTPAAPPQPAAALPAGTATMLPAGVPVRAGGNRRLIITVVAVVVILAAVVTAALTLGGGSSTTNRPVTARVAGKVPKSAVFAASNAALTDTAGVIKDASSLLAGTLAPATVSSSLRAVLTHPPAGGPSTPTLGAALALDDPQLPSCIASITSGDALFGIDRISYAGQPSLLIVTADSDSGTDAIAYVIGTGCALPGTGIRTVVTVPL